MSKTYKQQIESYYNDDAADFDARYWRNPVLQRIRQDFREQVKRHSFKNMLEIGFGTGLDLLHFTRTHPDVKIAGIDISSGMHQLALERLSKEKLSNVKVFRASVEEAGELFVNSRFDMIYVFFGALNTVEDLQRASDTLYRLAMPGGVLVLSFVNKYYVAGMFIELLKMRFKSAFSRLKPEWGGYSPERNLPSRCYTPSEIKKIFSGFKLKSRKGYSIVYPAWYYPGLIQLLSRVSRWLWKTDMLLNKTPLWRFGEYTLFVFQKPDDVRKH